MHICEKKLEEWQHILKLFTSFVKKNKKQTKTLFRREYYKHLLNSWYSIHSMHYGCIVECADNHSFVNTLLLSTTTELQRASQQRARPPQQFVNFPFVPVPASTPQADHCIEKGLWSNSLYCLSEHPGTCKSPVFQCLFPGCSRVW